MILRLRRLIPSAVLLFSSSCFAASVAQASEPSEGEPSKVLRPIALAYQQRAYFTDFGTFAREADNKTPDLGHVARFHGAALSGLLSPHLLVGLYANGALKERVSARGQSSWGGGLASIYGQYRISHPSGFYAGGGVGLGCGRFNYSAVTSDGTGQFLVNSNAFFIEPMANVGYEFLGRLFVQLEGTYLLRILAGSESVKMGKLPNAFPNGPLLSGSIGYRFRLL